MFLRELFESKKTAVFAFGRMNPPTSGHKKLVNKMKSLPGEKFLFLSHTQNAKTDPLDFNTKIRFAKQFFPDVNVGDPQVRTIIQALQKLETLGFTDLIYVAGSDRISAFEELLHKYNGSEYNFNSIQVTSSGDRDPDSDHIQGMSATKMRAAALASNVDAFKQGVPDPRLATALYNAVRTGVGVSATSENSLSEAQSITPEILKKLEAYVDRVFAAVGIDIEFTRHFLDRVNDPRNISPITIQELVKLFQDTYKKWGKKIAQLGPNAQAVIKDMTTDINMPFVLNWDPRRQELDLVAKTIMRKKNFATPNQEFPI